MKQLIASFYILAVAANAADAASAELLAELGCANCHTTLATKNSLRDRTPDLSTAGLRYNNAWLFDFLRNPVKIRKHLGRARMPSFYLNDAEALALVKFLVTQTNLPAGSPRMPSGLHAPVQPTPPNFQTNASGGLLCLTCHSLKGQGGALAVELSDISFRLRPDWVRMFLVDPAIFGVPPAVMPPQFYTNHQNQLTAIVPDPSRQIGTLVAYLFSLNQERRTALETQFANAEKAMPQIDAQLGAKIFTALNCAACHRHSQSPRTNAAPDLVKQAARIKQPWLESFLAQPHAIRPFGFHPGDGSRMPNFRLTSDEVKEISSFIVGTAQPAVQTSQSPQLSAFALRKTSMSLDSKLSCLGCHRLGEKGGRIGPDLTSVGKRLQPDYVLRMIRDPRVENPHTIMPRLPLSLETAQTLTAFLFQQSVDAKPTAYLSLAEHPLVEENTTYATHCSVCHGAAGKGDGFNARCLPTKPTAHADPALMATRPDDTLYDGIHSGGLILNKSPYMPPWGETLKTAEIRGLVERIRQLCQCAGPPWSRDGKP